MKKNKLGKAILVSRGLEQSLQKIKGMVKLEFADDIMTCTKDERYVYV